MVLNVCSALKGSLLRRFFLDAFPLHVSHGVPDGSTGESHQRLGGWNQATDLAADFYAILSLEHFACLHLLGRVAVSVDVVEHKLFRASFVPQTDQRQRLEGGIGAGILPLPNVFGIRRLLHGERG